MPGTRYTRLISAVQLHRLMQSDASCVILDCRFSLNDAGAGRRIYDEDHLPGAFYADLNRDLAGPVTANSGRHPLPEPAVFAQSLSKWGVTYDSQVICYDDSGGAIAARAWWMLRQWLGFNAALLDGGYAAWRRAGYLASTKVPGAVSGPVPTLEPNAAVLAHAGELLESSALLFDARSRERFEGITEPVDKQAGHVPGALNLPYTENLDAEGCFLPVAQLRARFEPIVRSSAKPISMCGSGVTACHNILAMEVAGIEDVRLYPGSWSEWITDPQRPLARADEKSSSQTPIQPR